MKRLTSLLAAFTICCFLTAGVTAPVLAQENNNSATQTDDNDDDKDYGWIGLIGLAGLLGLRKRDRDDRDIRTTTNPRV